MRVDLGRHRQWHQLTRRQLLPAIVVTASYALCLLGLLDARAIGTDHSDRRFWTIGINFVVVFAMAIADRSQLRSNRTSFSGFAISAGLVWAYLWIVSAAV